MAMIMRNKYKPLRSSREQFGLQYTLSALDTLLRPVCAVCGKEVEVT